MGAGGEDHERVAVGRSLLGGHDSDDAVAPLRFSTTIDQPCWALIHWAMMRGMPS